jgi:hypothetical protein
MNDEQAKRLNESLRVMDALAETLIGQSDAEVLEEAARDGIRPQEAQRRVLEALNKARVSIATSANASARAPSSEASVRRPVALTLDASRARAILKRVAAAIPTQRLAWPQAAQLREVQGDEEALEMVAALKDLGVIADKDLE